jgi:hypothetical protein
MRVQTRPQPDLEAHLWDQIADLDGVTSWAYSAIPSFPPWLVAYSVQVDCRAGGKASAWQLAEAVRQRLWDLPSAPWDQGVVVYSQVTEGPFWLPDIEGAPRYVLRAEIRARPRRDWTGPAEPPEPISGRSAAGVSGKDRK